MRTITILTPSYQGKRLRANVLSYPPPLFPNIVYELSNWGKVMIKR
ncbi:hypothetical protein B4134_2319 [Bacillus safensis]|nr:hypothetical protein B4134_2319 [Bacillus safensis]